MAREKRGPKTEALSLRLDPKSRFVLEFIARVKGQGITVVVERAIQSAATELSREGDGLDWDDYWNVSQGVRSLKLWSNKKAYPSFEEEEIVAFTLLYWPFFYAGSLGRLPLAFKVDVLWPRIDEFVAMWRRTKSTDPGAVAKAMGDALLQAGFAPPKWPIDPDHLDHDTDIPF